MGPHTDLTQFQCFDLYFRTHPAGHPHIVPVSDFQLREIPHVRTFCYVNESVGRRRYEEFVLSSAIELVFKLD